MTGHPNATAAAIGGALTTILVWILGAFGVEPTAEVSAAFTTLIIALLLFAKGRKPNSTARRQSLQ